MNNQGIDRGVADNWDNVSWATDKDWVRLDRRLNEQIEDKRRSISIP